MEKIKLTQAVVVEGKYDKIKLSEFLDAFVVETNGFGIFKDKQRLSFIKKLAAERGIILLTDSDHAGFMIRHYISSGIPKDRITNVYIPDVYGKEKRKPAPSKEGKLGVEGMTADTIIAALERANVEHSRVFVSDPITIYDLYSLGFNGTPNAKQNRLLLQKKLDLPSFLSSSALVSCLNNMMTRQEFFEFVKKI